jgi:hypothetical protein
VIEGALREIPLPISPDPFQIFLVTWWAHDGAYEVANWR